VILVVILPLIVVITIINDFFDITRSQSSHQASIVLWVIVLLLMCYTTPMIDEIVPKIFKITVPIPFPLRTVNVYALAGEDGWAMIDTSMGTPDTREALWEGLKQAGLRLEELRAIVLSHHHPDHVGLSGELYERTHATMYMHRIDANAIAVLWSGQMQERFGRVSGFFGQHGMPSTDFWFTQVEPGVMRNLIRVPPREAITRVEDGETITLAGEQYRVIWTPGHSDGHICLFRERDGVFIAADHVLPRITPNIGLYSANDRQNPLGDYLDSLEKVEHLPASIVLPGHGEPFADLAGRVREIIAHHEERVRQILALLDGRPQHAYGIAEQLFERRWENSEARRMAVAETLSHLEYLRSSGRVGQQRSSDGLILYSVA
jgi:glyoxylase-like metal-dependent hydrolase (beta-lactamase superfamily II)